MIKIGKGKFMKTIILYAVTEKLPENCKMKYVEVEDKGERILIRGEVVNKDLLDALDSAKPKSWESVCNTHPLCYVKEKS